MRLLLALLLAIGLGGCERPANEMRVSITDPNVNMPAVKGRPAAGYFELEATANLGALTSVTSPQAGRIEMHETVTEGTTSSMRGVSRVPVDGGKTISFQPGGNHLMLFDLDPALAPGKEMELTFHFENGEPVTAVATLHPPGGGHGAH